MKRHNCGCVWVEAFEGRVLLSAGDLDTGFAAGGKASPDLVGPSIFLGVDSVVQPDGKTVVVEQNRQGVNENTSAARGPNVVRLLAGGAVDTSFGVSGRVDFGGDALSIARQADGKLLVGGGSGDRAVLARYLVTGKLDTSFGAGGRVTLKWANASSVISQVEVGADGSIFVAGAHSGTPVGSSSVVARFTSSGTVDTGFGAAGVVELGGFTQVAALAPTADGGVLIGTNVDLSTWVSRLTKNGARDSSFGEAGNLRTPLNFLGDVAVQGDGRIVVAGAVGADAAVVRYTGAGKLDTSFGAAGIATKHYGVGSAGAREVLIQADGSIVVAVDVQVGGGASQPRDLRVLKFTAGGKADTSFGVGGEAVAVVGRTGWTTSLAQGAGGKIVLTGRVVDLDKAALEVVRWDSAGRLDSGFGAGGKVAVKGAVRQYTTMTHAVLQPDGKTLAVGYAVDDLSGGNVVPMMARFTTNGAADVTFGTGGVVLGPIGVEWNAVVFGADGRIVVTGSVANPSDGYDTDVVVARYNANGTIDQLFGNKGVVRTSVLAKAQEIGEAVAVLPGGKILVGANLAPERSDGPPGPEDLLFLRYSETGSLDRTYGPSGRGWARIDLGQSEGVRAMSVASNGVATVVGSRVAPSGTSLMLAARVGAGGSLDKSFGGGDGWVAWQWSDGGAQDEARGLAVQKDGKVVVAGAHRVSSGHQFGVARLTSAGGLDPTFGSGGLVKTAMGVGESEANAVALGADGRIVVGGTGQAKANDGDFALARYTPAGLLDGTFGSGGRVFTNLGRTDERVADVFVLSNGRILAAGTSFRPQAVQESRMSEVRYLYGQGGDIINGTLTIDGTSGNDTITASLVSGSLVVKVNGVAKNYVPWQVKKLIVNGGSGNDAIVLSPGVPDSVLDGGSGNDSLVGGAGRGVTRCAGATGRITCRGVTATMYWMAGDSRT